MAIDETDQQGVAPASAQGAAAQLKAAREAKGLSLAGIAAETRIPLRQLQLIEAGDFGALPGRSYATGFSRSYAKAVGLDPEAILNKVRAELDRIEPRRHEHSDTYLEPGDPARVPPARLAWLLALGGLLLLAGLYAAYRSFIAPPGELPPVTAEAPALDTAQEAPAEAAPNPAGEVVFTALEEGIWVKFYDAAGRQLMQKQMARGESYTIPAEAEGPQIWTGRPDALAITIGGQAVPRLSERERVVRDVPVSAAALLERTAPPAPAASPTG